MLFILAIDLYVVSLTVKLYSASKDDVFAMGGIFETLFAMYAYGYFDGTCSMYRVCGNARLWICQQHGCCASRGVGAKVIYRLPKGICVWINKGQVDGNGVLWYESRTNLHVDNANYNFSGWMKAEFIDTGVIAIGVGKV